MSFFTAFLLLWVIGLPVLFWLLGPEKPREKAPYEREWELRNAQGLEILHQRHEATMQAPTES